MPKQPEEEAEMVHDTGEKSFLSNVKDIADLRDFLLNLQRYLRHHRVHHGDDLRKLISEAQLNVPNFLKSVPIVYVEHQVQRSPSKPSVVPILTIQVPADHHGVDEPQPRACIRIWSRTWVCAECRKDDEGWSCWIYITNEPPD